MAGGTGPVTLADVARVAGVAKSTASNVFAGSSKVSADTAARVRAAAEELGYRGPSALARALATGHSRTVALMTGAFLENPGADPFSLYVIDGLQREFVHLGYGVLLLPPVTDPESEALARGAVFDGVVTVRRMAGFEASNEILAERRVPWLSLDYHPTESAAVVMDDATPMEEMVRRLTDLGHERIGVVAFPISGAVPDDRLLTAEQMRQVAGPAVSRRLEGVARAGVEPAAVFCCSEVSRDCGVAAADAFMAMDEPPTAIVCFADIIAAGVIQGLQALGHDVPGDVSVTGFDGLPKLPGIAPLELETVVQDGVEKGRVVARHLVASIEGRSVDPVELPFRLRRGTTVAPPPGGDFTGL